MLANAGACNLSAWRRSTSWRFPPERDFAASARSLTSAFALPMSMAPSVRGSRRHRWLLAWLTGTLVLASGRPSRGDDKNPTVSLGLTRGAGAEACITAHELAQRVEARLGHATFVSAAQADLFVDARVARAGGGWSATVAASRANGAHMGVRKLASASRDCHSLDEELVLVVALVIDPLATSSPPVPAPAHRDVIYVPMHVPGASPRWSFGARVATTLLGGVLPSVAPGLEASGAVTPPGAWPIELGAIVTRRARAEEDGHGVDARLAIATLAVCPELLERERFRLQLCGGGAAGVLFVRSHGLGSDGGDDHPAGLLFGRVRGSVRVTGGIHAALDLGMTVPLARRTMYYTALDPDTLQVKRHDLYSVEAVGWSASLGLGVQIR
jgi:hypothetical protein